MDLPNALNAILEPGEVLSAPVNRLLVLVDFTPGGRRRIVARHSVCQGRRRVVGTRGVKEGPLVAV